MRNILSKREYDGKLPEMRLSAVWYVDEDSTYQVSKRNRAEDGYVAVRTMTGTGKMELYSGDTFILPADSLGIFAIRQVLNYGAGEDGWQFYWFEFEFDGALPPFFNQPVSLRMSSQEQIEMERCFQSLNRNSVYECMRAEALFRYLLADWQVRSAENKRIGVPVQDILALLEKGRRERIGMAELAREAGMCERSFRDTVHRITGLSPKAYMLKGEMDAAMELLRTTGMTVSEIAALFNYSSPFYFSRVFSRYYGISPKKVRDRIEL